MTTISLSNIPDEVFERIKAAAESNRRSVQEEIMNRIQNSLLPERKPSEKIKERIRKLHAGMKDRIISMEEIDRAKRDGRP
ncbi:MAG: Arc family DNA-binding protein [Desulfococcaceae bacterium]